MLSILGLGALGLVILSALARTAWRCRHDARIDRALAAALPADRGHVRVALAINELGPRRDRLALCRALLAERCCWTALCELRRSSQGEKNIAHKI